MLGHISRFLSDRLAGNCCFALQIAYLGVRYLFSRVLKSLVFYQRPRGEVSSGLFVGDLG